MAEDHPWDKALGTPLPEEKKRRNGKRTAAPQHFLTGGAILASSSVLQLKLPLSLELHILLRTSSCLCVAQVAALALLAAWWASRSRSHMGQLSDGSPNEDFLDTLERGSGRLRLPHGAEHDESDITERTICVPETAWQQLVAAKVRLPWLPCCPTGLP